MVIYLICLSLIMQGTLVENVTPEGIPRVIVKRLTTNSTSFTVLWYPVENKDESDPVIGYKMKVWIPPCVNETVYEYENDDQIKVVTTSRAEFDPRHVPQEKADVYIVPADTLQVSVLNRQIEIWYHVRVLAFTKTAEGPFSDSLHFKGVSVNDTACDAVYRIPLQLDGDIYEEYEYS